MQQRRSDRPEKGIFTGLLFLAIGLVLLLGNLELFALRPTLSRWWPVLLVVIGVKHLILFRGPGAWINAVFWIGTGTLFLSSTLGFLGIGLTSLIWPMMLIGLGICTIVGCGETGENEVRDRGEV